MAIVVSLREIVGEMELLNDEFHAYLNKVTGDIVTITDEDMAAIENEAEWGGYPEWQPFPKATATPPSGQE